MDSQIAYDTSLRGYPFTITLSSGVIANILISALTGTSLTYGDQGPSGSEMCTSIYQCRGKNEIWDARDVMIGPSVNYGPVRDPASSLRLYDLIKEQNQMAGHLMTGANIRDDPRRGRSAIIHGPTQNSPTQNSPT